MKDLGKVNSGQLYSLWKNYSLSLLIIVLTIIFSQILPYYLSPVVALLFTAALYFTIYNSKLKQKGTCVMSSMAVLYTIVGYSFVTIILNMFHVWGLFEMPREFIFFTDPFIPTLILNPIGFFVTSYLYLRHDKLQVCIECRMLNSMGGRRGAGGVLNREAHYQLKNLIFLFGILSLIIWLYYQFFYIDVNINGRDSYIFTGVSILGFLIDELYFMFRYYNLYLDMKEGNEIIRPEELQDMTAKTYLRFYMVCGNHIYVSRNQTDPNIPDRKVIDTPFFTKQTMNGILAEDVKNVIQRMSGIENGELRFFYGRKGVDDDKHSILRYFYFLDGTIEDYPELATEGEWMDFDRIKYLYSNDPSKLAELAVYDVTRLATIILTEKIFDENGFRKSRIRTYNPSFNLLDVRNSNIDFQDDKWIKISMFNSDTPLYKFKKWCRGLLKSSKEKWG